MVTFNRKCKKNTELTSKDKRQDYEKIMLAPEERKQSQWGLCGRLIDPTDLLLVAMEPYTPYMMYLMTLLQCQNKRSVFISVEGICSNSLYA